MPDKTWGSLKSELLLSQNDNLLGYLPPLKPFIFPSNLLELISLLSLSFFLPSFLSLSVFLSVLS
jgi:hypothetical protein